MEPAAEARCLNCEAVLQAAFCGQCGQHAESHPLSMREILKEFAEEVFHLEGKLALTLKALVRHPGLLTLEYWRGRRARYVGPLRLYFAASLLFFLVWSVHPPKLMDIRSDTAGGELDPAAQTSLAAQELRKHAATQTGNVKKVVEHGAAFLALGPEEMARREVEGFAHLLPKAMFVLIPAFALLLKLLYWRSGRLYAEHFIFALHFHALAFIVLAVSWLVPNEVVKGVVQLGLMVYLLLALHRAYAQGWAKTFVKEVLLTCVHGVTLGLAMGAIMLVSMW